MAPPLASPPQFDNLAPAHEPVTTFRHAQSPSDQAEILAGAAGVRNTSIQWDVAAAYGDIIRGAFIIDTHDREIRSPGKRSHGSFASPPHVRHEEVNAGIGDADMCDIMLRAVETRFHMTPEPVAGHARSYIRCAKFRAFANILG